MSTWEAHVAREAASPAEMVDAEARYLLIAPLVAASALWVDLGCGTGVAASRAFGADRPQRTLLVDRSPEALELARGELGPDGVETLRADLAGREGADAVRAAAASADGSVLVSCLDVIHELVDFTELVGLLCDLGTSATVVVSAPDDAAGAVADPRRASAWSAGAIEELQRLLPDPTRVLTQAAARASIIVPAQTAEDVALGGVGMPADAPAVHHLLAFGDRAGELGVAVRAQVADVAADLAQARRRESDLAFLEARVAELESAT